MRKMRTVAAFPTMFTLGNLVCGFFAIVVAARVDAPTTAEIPHGHNIRIENPGRILPMLDPEDDTHNVMLAGWLIFLAMIFDALDGHVARLTKATSDFGAQLDSLADLVTFGVAPAFLLVKMCPRFAYSHREAIWVIAAAFVVCAGLRLARFNVETTEDDDHRMFSGLPTPAAAAVIASFAMLFYTLRKEQSELGTFAGPLDMYLQQLLPLLAILLSLLMVSRIPYPHIVNLGFRGEKTFAHIVALVFGLMAVFAFRRFSLPILCAGFALVPPIWFLIRRAWQHRTKEEPLFE